jgi:hypothetical protein
MTDRALLEAASQLAQNKAFIVVLSHFQRESADLLLSTSPRDPVALQLAAYTNEAAVNFASMVNDLANEWVRMNA